MTSTKTVSNELAAIIGALHEQLKKEFLTDFAYTIVANGTVIAASNFSNGHVEPAAIDPKFNIARREVPKLDDEPFPPTPPYPTDAELIEAGIDPEVYADPELHGDKERAFFWQREARACSARSGHVTGLLANHFKCPATWEFILPRILPLP